MNINDKAKRILVYGDSYTFGKIPGGLRFDSNTRFTGILQKELGANHEIVEEGLRGRTLEGENGFFPYRDGINQFGPILGSHVPLDIVTLFLGTNDTNSKANKNPQQITDSFNKYINLVNWWCEHLSFPKPKVLIVAPPNIKEENSYNLFKDIFRGAEEKVKELPELYATMAKVHNLEFLDSSKIIKVSPIDGVHLDEENNKILGEALAQKILSIC